MEPPGRRSPVRPAHEQTGVLSWAKRESGRLRRQQDGSSSDRSILDVVMRVPLVLGYEEWVEAARNLDRGPTADDVPITRDGRRLDSRDKVLAFLAEVKADLEAGHRLADELV